jgi:hypothetical protein
MLQLIVAVPLGWLALTGLTEFARTGSCLQNLSTNAYGALVLFLLLPLLYFLALPLLWLVLLLAVPTLGWETLLDRETWTKFATNIAQKQMQKQMPVPLKRAPTVADFPRKPKAPL